VPSGVIRRLEAERVVEIAEPFGVVAAVVPSTNPTSTAIYKILVCLKARCAVVLSPHPAAAGCVRRVAEVMTEAAVGAGMPEDAVTCMTTVTLEGTQELMRRREIALVLDRPLAGPNVTNIEAARAVGGAVAAIEVVDSRIADWRIRLADTISDLASIGGVVLGSRIVPVDFDLRLVGMTFSLNGSIVATGAGAAALGNPITALAWLANTLAPHGVTLEPGMFIMTGALHAAVDVDAGDVGRADFDRLGPVSLRMA